jgi:hypothetical protein
VRADQVVISVDAARRRYDLRPASDTALASPGPAWRDFLPPCSPGQSQRAAVNYMQEELLER